MSSDSYEEKIENTLFDKIFQEDFDLLRIVHSYIFYRKAMRVAEASDAIDDPTAKSILVEAFEENMKEYRSAVEGLGSDGNSYLRSAIGDISPNQVSSVDAGYTGGHENG
jgi:hypothetical protein